MFPTVDDFDKPPEGGAIHRTPAFCAKADRSTCRNFYEGVKGSPGIHVCPYGYSTIVRNTSSGPRIYSGMKIDGHFDRKKLKRRKHQSFYPQFPADIVGRILVDTERTAEIREKNVEVGRFINETIHEIRRLNAQIIAQAHEVSHEVNRADLDSKLKYRIENVIATSSLISSRLDFYDITNNPGLIEAESKKRIGVYKKFDKVRHCLQIQAAQKDVRIDCVGEDHTIIEAHPVFDLLPFVLLENALKYSPKGNSIEINFQDVPAPLTIRIISTGPLMQENEIPRAFEKEFRGSNAGMATPAGSGIGLHFAKLICGVHGMSISIDSDRAVQFQLNDIPYSKFEVTLTLPT